MHYLSLFFAGIFICNCIPHLASGLTGLAFPTPFAQPRGVGRSSPLVNFYWGWFNLVVAIVLLVRHPLTIGANWDCAAVLSGTLLIGTYLAIHFGKVQHQALIAR